MGDMAERGSSIDLHDAGPMRALAHPLRLRILGLLRVEGPQSVGMLAEATGAASGSVSYHVQTLAKHSFVVPAPEFERDGRERWWRAAHEMTSWKTEEFIDDPEKFDQVTVATFKDPEGNYVQLLQFA